MSHTVTASQKGVRLNETDRTASILQNISVILRTCQGDVPFYREFGLPMQFTDRPMNAAEPALIVEIREAIQLYEPRAELLSVKFTQDSSGILYPEVEVNIIDE